MTLNMTCYGMQNPTYVPLSNHSAYSLSEGAITISRLLTFCKQNNLPAVALTDTFNLFGAMEFSLEAKKVGIQPIIGAKIWIELPNFNPISQYHKHHPELYFHPLTLLVTNHQGYQNLTKLISRAYQQRHPFRPLSLHHSILEELSSGLIALSGKINFQSNNQLTGIQRKQEVINSVDYLAQTFDNHLYIELSRYGFQEEYQVENDLIDTAQLKGIPLVATNEAYFVEEREHDAHDALLCIANQTVLRDQNRRRLTPHHRLKTYGEMATLFKDVPEALSNTVAIAQRCNFVLEIVKPRLPAFPTLKKEIDELKDQAQEGLAQRLINQVIPQLALEADETAVRQIYQDRLNYEINVIETMGYAGYYLIVADFIKWAKSQDIPVGPGRGSGAGSLVAWSLTITDVDPIAFNLLFERFLNPERISMPDFDIDFCQDKRGLVIDYVCQKYGRDRVAQIITFGKFQARMALRDVGRVMGLPYGKVDSISKMVPNNPANPVTLSQAIEQEPDLRMAIEKDPEVSKLVRTSLQLEGLYRHASTHAAGIVIGDEPLENIVPLYYDSATENAPGAGQEREPGTGLPATQFSMKYVELAGLVKFDFLGLKTLTVMQETINLMRKRGIEFNLNTIPLNDKKTFELLCRIETVGVFQLESAGMRDVIRKLQPSNFEEIIALVALYRPGPMDDIPRYIACKHGHEAISYTHPQLEPILKETYGVMVYQEQVMQIAQDLAGYSLGQADLLRRAMGKKIASEMEAQRDTFVKGCQDKGMANHIAVQIFEQMAKFASYGFNKCHSAPYGLIAYQTAYLKANFPVEFLAALMTLDLHNTDKLTVIREEANRMGVKILPPSVEKSFAQFHVEKLPEDTVDSKYEHGIRYALSALKNVGVQAVTVMVEERTKNGPYKCVLDFFCRHDSRVLNKRFIENLTAAGGFDNLYNNRAQLYETIPKLMLYASHASREKEDAQQLMFDELNSVNSFASFKWADTLPWSSEKRLEKEFEAIGYYLTEHPLDRYRDVIESLNITQYRDLEEMPLTPQGQAVCLAGVILSKKERIGKTGSRFAFIQFSDQTMLFEAGAFSEVYNQARDFIKPGTRCFINAIAKREDESVRLVIQSIKELDRILSQSNQGTLVIDVANLDVAELLYHQFAVGVVKDGMTAVNLRYKIPDHNITICLNKKFDITPTVLEYLKLKDIAYTFGI